MKDFFKPIMPELAAFIVFSAFVNLLMLVSPIYMLHLYDKVLASHSMPTLVSLTLVAMALTVVMGLLDAIRARLQLRASGDLDQALSGRLFQAVFARTVKYPGEPAFRAFSDLRDLRAFLTGTGLSAFVDAPWAVMFLAVVFLMHPLLGLVALAGVAILFGAALLSEALTRGPMRRGQSAGAAAGTYLSTALQSAEAVAAMGMLPDIQRRWSQQQEQAMALQETAAERSASILAATKSIRLLLQISVLGMGAWLSLEQEIGPAVMIASSIIMTRALAPVEQAIGAWRGFVAARDAATRLSKLLAGEALPPDRLSLPRPRGRLDIEQVLLTPPGGGAPLLKGVTLTVEPGTILGVVGPSGAGKSVLGRVMVGVARPTAGHVRLDSADLVKWPDWERGRHVGYLPQDVQLFDGTIRDNIARFTEPAEAEAVIAAAQAAGIHDMVLRLPDGYETRIGSGGVVLSGGQRQRVGLARALYGEPPLLVLDEPDASLDDEGERALRRCLLDLKMRGRTVIVISHRGPLVRLCDRLLAMRGGQTEFLGPRDGVLAELRARYSPQPRPVEAVAPDREDSKGSVAAVAS